jgi:hypothetical protein
MLGETIGIDAGGTVSFFSQIGPVRQAILSGNGGPLTTIADQAGLVAPGGYPLVAEDGTVAFIGIDSQTDRFGVYLSRDGTLHQVGTQDDIGRSRFLPLAMNDRGTVATGRGTLGTGGADGPKPLFELTSGRLAGNFAINDRLDVVFEGVLDNGLRGIFAGPDPIADKVIADGDSLFGSTVRQVEFLGDGGMNNRGDVAFHYELADLRVGIAVAKAVPEPTAAALLWIAVLVACRRRRPRTPGS